MSSSKLNRALCSPLSAIGNIHALQFLSDRQVQNNAGGVLALTPEV